MRRQINYMILFAFVLGLISSALVIWILIRLMLTFT